MDTRSAANGHNMSTGSSAANSNGPYGASSLVPVHPWFCPCTYCLMQGLPHF